MVQELEQKFRGCDWIPPGQAGRPTKHTPTSLPLVLVHDPADATDIQLHFTDAQAHPVGVRINALNLSTAGRASGSVSSPPAKPK